MALTAFPEADQSPPVVADAPFGLATLARIAMPGTDLGPIGRALIDCAQSDPDNADALLDLSLVLELSGHPEESLAVQHQALAIRRLYRGAAAQPAALRLLALMSPGNLMANTPLELLLEGSDVALTRLYLMPDEPLPADLPAADRVFVAIGESTANRSLLEGIERAVRDGRLRGMPVINRPAGILGLARDAVGDRLRDIAGVRMPITRRADRAALARLAAGIGTPHGICEEDWPLVVRPVDSHAGHGLERIDGPAALRAYLLAAPLVESFYVSAFVDYRDADGLYRKRRVMLIDGQPHLAHLAVSQHWMIHYLNAGMAEHPERRAEEADALASFDREFVQRHARALAAIHERLDLDYLGLDCAQTPDGRLLVFEADTAMVVHAMDPLEAFGYKQPAMQHLFAAFRQMLARPR